MHFKLIRQIGVLEAVACRLHSAVWHAAEEVTGDLERCDSVGAAMRAVAANLRVAGWPPQPRHIYGTAFKPVLCCCFVVCVCHLCLCFSLFSMF